MSNATEYEITERPITGDVNAGDVNTTEQITKEEFLAKLDTVLALPHVKAVKWAQYTPYFNDGDACVFGIGEPRLVFDLPESDEDEGEYGDGSVSNYELYNGTLNWTGVWGQNRRADVDNSPEATFEYRGIDTKEHYIALSNFGNSAASWERVAQLSFGDHAEVTATRDGFNVEYYEHD